MSQRIKTRADGVVLYRHQIGKHSHEWREQPFTTKQAVPTLNPKFDLSCGHASETIRQGCSGTLFRCGLHGELASKYPCADAQRICQTCPDRQSTLLQLGVPPHSLMTTIKRFDQRNLHPGILGTRFNPAIIEYQGGYAIAYRNSTLRSSIYLSRMSLDLSSTSEPVKLTVDHPDARWSVEDSRFFWFRSKLHLMFIGVTEVPVNGMSLYRTSVMYARLGDDLQAEEVFAPHYHARNFYEKNWGFFEHDNELYAIYGIAPHVVLKIDGNRANKVHETITPAPWTSGECRGSTSPILIGDEYFVWFHSSVASEPPIGHRTYDIGAYTFEARPPFRVQRFTLNPLVYADHATKPASIDKSVLFPCGAILDGDRWRLSCGIHDAWSEIREISHAEVERRMTRIAPPQWWSWQECAWDIGIFSSVVGQDEYKLASIDLKGASVLDIGAHVGSFAYAASQRGASLIHCYEPDPASVPHLRSNTARIPGTTVYAEAIGEMVGALDFRGAGHMGLPAQPSPLGVPTISLDTAIEELAETHPSGRVTLLKIDAERGEWPAFLTAKRLDLVNRIVGEWHSAEWRGRSWGRADIHRLLEPHGFRVTSEMGSGSWGPFTATRN